MDNVNHSTLTDPHLHESKGVASAGAGQVYVTDGSGSGNWVEKTRFIGAYVAFDSTTPAYTHSVTTSDTVFDPTLSSTTNNGFSVETSPNARVKYTGSEDINAQTIFTISSSNADSVSREVEFALFKNGVELAGSRTIRSISSSTWGSISVFGYTSLSTNDYLEVKVKGDASFTMNVASAFMSVMGSAQ